MYIYLDKQQAKKNTALVKWCYETRLENYNQEEVVEYIANDIPHFITYVEETDSIREATEEEKLARKQIELADNEVIIDNRIYSYDKKYQKVVNSQIVDKSLKELVEEGIITLEDVKNRKREELKTIRDKKCKENLEMNGSLFQVRNTEDRAKFDRIFMGVLAKVLKEDDTEEWRLADNTYKIFTYQELSKISKLYSDREREIFKKFKELDTKLKTADTVESIEKIKWE
ncbi:hypothetical protein A2U11_08340 [Fusobacterium necrophorum subsp. funduliforme]|uniref:DUF4376 domain-containing protein n=1 Tax=Fusobacterium necrophorum TaxID=859 RepID=UPI000787DB6C|nr:DUF4376 domain-containing protein [Fusobacterium necrophorum]KYM50708.1 hypothetical protein A2U11_08340 [Fusobacterium necrophorum subsp. funduliforme]